MQTRTFENSNVQSKIWVRTNVSCLPVVWFCCVRVGLNTELQTMLWSFDMIMGQRMDHMIFFDPYEFKCLLSSDFIPFSGSHFSVTISLVDVNTELLSAFVIGLSVCVKLTRFVPTDIFLFSDVIAFEWISFSEVLNFVSRKLSFDLSRATRCTTSFKLLGYFVISNICTHDGLKTITNRSFAMNCGCSTDGYPSFAICSTRSANIN